MDVKGTTPILNVSDIGASVAWFEKLGWRVGFTWNDGGSMIDGTYSNEHGPANFGSVCCGKAEIFLCRGYQGSRGRAPKGAGDEDTGGVWMTLWLESPAAVTAAYTEAVAAGVSVGDPPEDMDWNVREFLLRHPDGHTFRVSAGVE
jgi:catechol 2,3-dioxygenase-like lactoylglutathione lyase family enzyme